MLDAPVRIFSDARLIPIYGSGLELAINIGPGLIVPKGTALGLVTSSANDTWTLTITGTPTGGTFTITVTREGTSTTTAAIAYNASTAVVQSAVQAIVGVNVTVTGNPGTSYVLTFTNYLAGIPIPSVTATGSFTGGTAPAIDPVHTTTGRSAATYKPYAGGNGDGSQVPRCLAKFDMASDSDGKITLGLQAGGDQWGASDRSAPAFFSGTFKTDHLVGFDANALTAWAGARLLAGSVTSGIVRLP